MKKVPTKTDVWNKVVDILSNNEINENDEMFKDLSELLKPKKSGARGDRPEPIVVDDETYYYCRYTGRFWKSEDMIYQNDEARNLLKDKGYSKIGISLWNKGQKFIKTMKEELFDEIMSDSPDTEKMSQLKTDIANYDGNTKESLIEFITDEQSKTIDSDSISN